MTPAQPAASFPSAAVTISGQTRLLGVIGDPVKHSLSPVMHNAAIAALGVDYAYLPFPVSSDQLATAIAGFAAIDLVGFNVTIPHKQAVMAHLVELTPVARAIGAVNTIWRTPAGWVGTNTDVTGFLAPLQARSLDWANLTVVILGNGGAARAVVAGCAMQGCAAIQVVGRDLAKLHAFAASWAEAPWPLPLEVHSWDDLDQVLPQAQLVVNTTPIGMAPQVQASPLTPAQIELLPALAIAYDLIYTPSPTQFLANAQAAGRVAIDGAEMLINQGAAALEIWLDRPVPIEIMRQALHAKLQR